jgi:PhnB protein
MTTRLNPYLSFRDNAREVIEFYHGIFGGDLNVTTFGEFQASDDPEEKDKVMHGMLVSPNGLVLMVADTPNSMEMPSGSGNITISLSGEDEAELRGYWDKLSDGGQVIMPFDKAPWGDIFGMCTDRYGTPWMIDVIAAQPAAGQPA